MNGKLCYEGTDLNEFKKVMITAIIARGESKFNANQSHLCLDLRPDGKNQGRALFPKFGFHILHTCHYDFSN